MVSGPCSTMLRLGQILSHTLVYGVEWCQGNGASVGQASENAARQVLGLLYDSYQRTGEYRWDLLWFHGASYSL